MNIQEILATLYDQRKRRNEATTVLSGVTDRPKRKRLPKNPYNAPLRLSAAEKKRIANSRRKLRTQLKRMKELARPNGY
jgi:hypothetical protein